MKKIFILDTNVLLHDPKALNHFEDNDIMIPLKVIEEIDQFKRELSERGRNAREIARMLDDYRHKGRLNDGVKLESGGMLRVAFLKDQDPFSRKIPPDDIILKMAREISEAYPNTPCIVISKDINLRLKADFIGLNAEDYENGKTAYSTSEFYDGFQTLEVSREALAEFSEEERLRLPEDAVVAANEYMILQEQGEPANTMLGRYDSEAACVLPLIPLPDPGRMLKPRNKEQWFAIDALLNDQIKLVTLSGKAGTGKTLLAVAAGVLKTLDEKIYKKLLVSRPIFPMGKDLGYLPGTIEEKLDPWMQPIHDALELVAHGRFSAKKNRDGSIMDAIDIEPLTYIRGRSIPQQFMIIDEAQNLTPLEVKTVITRVGHDTKIVLTGDMYQIDNPYVDVLSNGLNAVMNKFKQEPIAAHVMLTEGVRSEIAELAANLM